MLLSYHDSYSCCSLLLFKGIAISFPIPFVIAFKNKKYDKYHYHSPCCFPTVGRALTIQRAIQKRSYESMYIIFFYRKVGKINKKKKCHQWQNFARIAQKKNSTTPKEISAPGGTEYFIINEETLVLGSTLYAFFIKGRNILFKNSSGAYALNAPRLF